ncbi:PRC-barrel domain-containing protein [Salinarimonas rosea]|uniref:PRC-barrel domain-containing protein n=1 Tax=Salinarimonas rosea TaxID=552063 RepID=UPI00069463E3|nr:PRC-barrel domain-containing protein [Salinarimonas rosea]
MKRIFLAALVGSTALAPAALMAQTQQNQQQGQQQQMTQAQSGQTQGQQGRVTAQQMRGQPLVGANGNRIGTVEQIVIGRSGQSYAVVAVQDGQNRLLPTQAIVLRDGRLYVQDITREQVAQLRSATEAEGGEFQAAEREQVLVLAMESGTEGRMTQDRERMAEADGASIVVERTAPRLRIEQPTPQVTVDPAEPEVTVRQQNPQILVRQAPPRVTIEQPQPEIIVRMPEPQVDVAQGRPEVMVRQGEPQVQVEQPQQQAAVAVEQSQAQVTIEDDGQQAQIATTQARPEVTFERTGEPQVEFLQAQGQPTVRYERMQTEQQAGMQIETEQTAEMDRARGMLIDENEVEATGAVNATTRPVAISELEGETVYNFRGQELGDVERIVATPNDDFLVVIGAGGFLGLGEDTVALPLDRLSMRGDQLMVRGITEADIEGMQDYEARYPNAQPLGADEDVDLIVEQ